MTRRARPLVLVIGLLLSLGYGSGVRAQATPGQSPPVVSVPGTVSPATTSAISSQPAVPVAQVQSPAAPSHFQDQAIWALMVSFAMQYIKKSSWFTWITPQTSSRIQSQIGFLLAILTAAGIHFAVTGSMFDEGGALITVTGLSMNAFKEIAWQWSAQQAWYRAVVKDPVPAAPPVVVHQAPVNNLVDALHHIGGGK